jgi:pyrophosphate--fructose-6-phosphate 1-phosphotransferase
VAAKKMTLAQISEDICAVVAKRAEAGENFGVVIIPEGVIEFIPEMKTLIGELNHVMTQKAGEYNAIVSFDAKRAWLDANLSPAAAATFNTLPRDIAEQFLIDRDPHGNVQVSRIDTEILLAAMVERRIGELKKAGRFHGKFSPYTHFLGYEGRCAAPSNFDANYCYSLGLTAFTLAAGGMNGYIASVQNLAAQPSKWAAGGIPLTMMMTMEVRHGVPKPVIKKALVDLDGAAFQYYAAHREEWALKTGYVYPGAPQYFGPGAVCDAPTKTLLFEHGRA